MPYRAAIDPHSDTSKTNFQIFGYRKTWVGKKNQTGAVVKTVLNLADKGQKQEVFMYFINYHQIKTKFKKKNNKNPAVRDSHLTSLLICSYEGQGIRGRNYLYLRHKEINLGSTEMLYCSALLATIAERKPSPSLITTTNGSLRADAVYSLNSILGMLLRYNCFYGELIVGQNKLF